MRVLENKACGALSASWIVNTIPYITMEWIKPKHSAIWNGSPSFYAFAIGAKRTIQFSIKQNALIPALII